MSKFIDATADKWFYRDIEELMNVFVDGSTFYSGIPYNIFAEGKPCIDYEVVNTKNGEHEFYIPGTITPNEANPLVVYIDGIQSAIDDIENQADGTTYVKLTRAVANGSIVRLFYAGEPSYVVYCCADEATVYSTMSTGGSVLGIMSHGDTAPYMDRPDSGNWFKISYGGGEGYVERGITRMTSSGTDYTGVDYPSSQIIIDTDYWYEYDPFNGITPEVVKCNGRQLQRVANQTGLTYDGLEYCIIDDYIYVNYTLNNEILEVVVLEKNTLGVQKPKYQKLRVRSDKIIYNNRFFPDILASKVEMLISIDHLRKNLLARYTDSSVDGVLLTTSRFTDIQAELDADPGNPPWWWKYICPLEQLKLPDGEYLLQGDDGELKIDMPITRAEMAYLIDKFRIWVIEAFK